MATKEYGLNLEFDITNLRGAEYNPRKIADEDIRVLGESIKRLGMVKPLIVRNDLLVAGHQRTKALRAAGINKAPAYLLSLDTTTYDEVRFNQLHNGTDMDSGDEECFLNVPLEMGYNVVDPSKMSANMRCRMVVVRHQIVDLIQKFGPWGGVVAIQETGEVVHCAQYAISAHITNTPLTVFAIPEARKDEYAGLLGRQYGVFHYDHVKRDTYVQSYAQPRRCVDGEREGMNSRLYMFVGIPWLEQNNGKSLRLIDFGSGQADSASYMRRSGYDLIDVELFRRVKSSHDIDRNAVNRMIDGLCEALSTKGLFDVVLCDSVINSVDTLEAEEGVMAMITGLCKPGGRVFFSGRSLEFVEQNKRNTKRIGNARGIEFLDENGFSGLWRRGRWFFQKFHTRETSIALAEQHGLKVVDFVQDTNAWQIHAIAPETDWDRFRRAAKFEFELPLPGGPIGRSADVIQAINLAETLTQAAAKSVQV